MSIVYRIADDTGVEVQAVDGTWSRPIFTGQEAASFDAHVLQWADLALSNQERTGVPANYTLGIIAGESNGNPNVQGHDPGGSTGLGLMQITAQALKQGLSDAEVMIPENNVRLGTDAMATSMKHVGVDLPKIASMFNCGGTNAPHASSGAPWGFCEYKTPQGTYPYISRVVRASNYALTVMPVPSSSTPGIPTSFGSALLKGAMGGIGLALGLTIAEDAGWIKRVWRW